MNTLVIVDQGIIDGERIVAVSYLEPTADWDSGFACFSVPPNKAADTDTAVMHLDCFINNYPKPAKEWTSHANTAKRSATTTAGSSRNSTHPFLIGAPEPLSPPQGSTWRSRYSGGHLAGRALSLPSARDHSEVLSWAPRLLARGTCMSGHRRPQFRQR